MEKIKAQAVTHDNFAGTFRTGDMPGWMRMRRYIAMAVLTLTVPASMIGGFQGLRILLTNQAMASVSDEAEIALSDDDKDLVSAAHAWRDEVARDPMRLAEFGRRQILILLDRPSLRRTEGAYHHWQYISTQCVMDIYLKVDPGREPARPVQLIDFHPRRKAFYQVKTIGSADGSAVDRRACMASLLKRDDDATEANALPNP